MSGYEEDFGCEEASAPATTSQSALSDEADSAYSTPAPKTGVSISIDDQHNRWCVEGQYEVYTDAKLPNDKGVMTWTLQLEWNVLTGSIPIMLAIHELFTRH